MAVRHIYGCQLILLSMKKFIFPLLLACSLILACSCQPKPVEPEPEPEPEVPTEFTAKYYNGFFVDALAGAYEYFVENDKRELLAELDKLPKED